jgi:periplasmic copper chaperone A
MLVVLNIAARIVVCCCAALALIGCGAGQITQTDRQVAAVDGTSGDVGDTIALRNVRIPYPHNSNGTYPARSTVPALLTIVNQGTSTDELIAVTSPAASQIVLLGAVQIPPGSTVASTAGTAAPTNSPLLVGGLRVLLTTSKPLRAGLNTPMTFQFRNAGKLTLPVPMALPVTSAS